MRKWQLCTPEVIESFNSDVSKFTTANCHLQAVLPNNKVQKMIVNQYVEVTQGGVTSKYFSDEMEAIDWLRSKLKERL